MPEMQAGARTVRDLLPTLGLSPQMPVVQSHKHDDGAALEWARRTWKRLKKSRKNLAFLAPESSFSPILLPSRLPNGSKFVHLGRYKRQFPRKFRFSFIWQHQPGTQVEPSFFRSRVRPILIFFRFSRTLLGK